MAAIRPITNSDKSALTTLYNDCFNQAPNIGSLLNQPSISGTIAHNNSHAIGFILWQNSSDSIDIIDIAILAKHRRQGIAKQLWHSMPKNQNVFIEVRSDNQPAIALYTSLGCQSIGLRKNYYKNSDGSHQDAQCLKFTPQ